MTDSLSHQSSAEDAVAEFIFGRINFERRAAETYELADFKLERMERLLELLDNPQIAIPAVHLAGTKGKGSTAAMIAAIQQAAGRRVGLYTSPHIDHFSERMTVNGVRPNDEELLWLLDELRPAVEAMDRLGTAMQPTFFEVLTAMAWLHFRRAEVDLVVLETGLGGRLDATNLCHPLVTVITSISRDHERLLGSTLESIAREKAGIIKPGVPVIIGVRDDGPRQVIREVTRERESPIVELGNELQWEQIDGDKSGVLQQCQTVRVSTHVKDHEPVRLPLPGSHQAGNLTLAIAATDSLREIGLQSTSLEIQTGLAGLSLPLRVEKLCESPLVIADVAHNPASIEALVETLRPLKVRRRSLIFATSKDKDAAAMLDVLRGEFDEVILTRFIGNPRATDRESLESAATLSGLESWIWADTPDMAWELAKRKAAADDLICATGSFFLAAEFRSLVMSELVKSTS